MRVISIIVHLLGLCHPALHKTKEDVAHPCLVCKCGVNFALPLFVFGLLFILFYLHYFLHLNQIVFVKNVQDSL